MASMAWNFADFLGPEDFISIQSREESLEIVEKRNTR